MPGCPLERRSVIYLPFRSVVGHMLNMAVIDIIGALVASLACAVAYDLIISFSGTQYISSFDYRYLPISKSRIAAVMIVWVAIFYLILNINPGNPPMLPLYLLIGAALIHFVVAQIDYYAQRRAGYRKPPNYSDRSDD